MIFRSGKFQLAWSKRFRKISPEKRGEAFQRMILAVLELATHFGHMRDVADAIDFYFENRNRPRQQEELPLNYTRKTIDEKYD